jgi:DNA-directed RNA polymerase alpha subunit
MNKAEVVKTLMDTEKRFGLVDTLHRIFGKNIKVNVGFSKSACDASIEELVLSVRSYNALRRANVTTLGDLIERLNEGGLKSIRNLGAKSVKEIEAAFMTECYDRLLPYEKAAFWQDVLDHKEGA